MRSRHLLFPLPPNPVSFHLFLFFLLSENLNFRFPGMLEIIVTKKGGPQYFEEIWSHFPLLTPTGGRAPVAIFSALSLYLSSCLRYRPASPSLLTWTDYWVFPSLSMSSFDLVSSPPHLESGKS